MKRPLALFFPFVELGAKPAAAQPELEADPRRFEIADGTEWLTQNVNRRSDLIFADTWPDKFFRLDEVLALLKPGSIHVIDDLLPQFDWPEGHQHKIDALQLMLKIRAA